MPIGQLIIRHRGGTDLAVYAVPSGGSIIFALDGDARLSDVNFMFMTPTLPTPPPSERDIRAMSTVAIARLLVERLEEDRRLEEEGLDA